MRPDPKHLGWWIFGGLVASVVGLSASGLLGLWALDPADPLGPAPALVGLAALALLPSFYYAWILGRGKAAPALRLVGAPAFLFLLTHVAVQLSGGLRSPLAAAYTLLVVVVTAHAGRFQGALLATLVLLLEGLAQSRLETPAFSSISVMVWATSPWVAWLAAPWLAHGLAAARMTEHALEPDPDQDTVPDFNIPESSFFDDRKYRDDSIDALLTIFFRSNSEVNAVMLWWLEEGKFVLSAGRSRKGDLVHGAQVEPGDGLVGYVLKEKTPMIVPDLPATSATTLPYYDGREEVKAFICLPLFDEDRLVGAVATDKLDDSKIHEGEIDSLRAMGNQIVREAQQAQFASTLAEKSNRFSALYVVGHQLTEELDRKKIIANFEMMLRRLLPFDSFYLALRGGKESDGPFEIVSKRGYEDSFVDKFEMKDDAIFGGWMLGAGEGMLHRVEEGGAVPRVFAEGMREPARSFLLMPLGVGGQVTGLLKIDRGEKVPFDKQDKEIISIFAGQAAAALQNARNYDLHKERATTDGLTGLYNHRYFQERLAQEMEKAAGEGKPLAFALTDIDLFKKFNDSFGHQEGDRVLKNVALMLQANVRSRNSGPWDIVSRYGGEEFCVILPDCDIVEARQVMERVRAACEAEISGGNDEEKRGVTLSIGISAFPQATRDQKKLIQLADAALYICKERGRNQVASYKDLPPDELEKI